VDVGTRNWLKGLPEETLCIEFVSVCSDELIWVGTFPPLYLVMGTEPVSKQSVVFEKLKTVECVQNNSHIYHRL
jgi:hypothetical protein